MKRKLSLGVYWLFCFLLLGSGLIPEVSAQRARGNRGGNGGDHFFSDYKRAEAAHTAAVALLQNKNSFKLSHDERLIEIYLRARPHYLDLVEGENFEIRDVEDWLYEEHDTAQAHPKMALAFIDGKDDSTEGTAGDGKIKKVIEVSLPYGRDYDIKFRSAFVNAGHEKGHLIADKVPEFQGADSHALLDDINRMLEQEYLDARGYAVVYDSEIKREVEAAAREQTFEVLEERVLRLSITLDSAIHQFEAYVSQNDLSPNFPFQALEGLTKVRRDQGELMDWLQLHSRESRLAEYQSPFGVNYDLLGTPMLRIMNTRSIISTPERR